MKHKTIFYAISIIVIFSMVGSLTTSTAQSPPTAAQPINLNAGMNGAEVMDVLPRDETLYFNGLQWGSVVCWNPYNSNCNNAMAIAQQDNALVTVFETPYIYNMLTGEQFPLLADGPYTWNEERTQITFKIKAAAHWSDGTPVTAEDVAYTWASDVKYNTQAFDNYQGFINNIVAVDTQTITITAKLDQDSNAINPLMVENYLNQNYVIQKAWTKTLEARSGGDANAFINDPALDFVSSGPYKMDLANDQIVVLIRDDNYWGQDASMWGKLPTPKYLAHVIFADNAASETAFEAGEVDVSQMFIPNVQDLWLIDGLPVSTYLPEAPYDIGAMLPTAFYNLASYGLDQVAVRKAIAMAVNYDEVVANAMSNQSATFEQVPRSLMIPLDYEQSLYDHDAVKDLQWTGNDITGANAILDTAGITDTNKDGYREYNGVTLVYTATCPYGWTDWQAAIELVAAAGQEIGIDIRTNYPEWIPDYQNAVTNWPLPNGYDIFMMWSDGAGPTQPWGRIDHLIGSEYAHNTNNWTGNWGGYINPTADAIIQAVPGVTDTVQLKEDYTNLTEIYLSDIPSFTLMYRPQYFYNVNKSVWTNFPHQGDGTNPAIPPLDLIYGYSIAGLYNLVLKTPVFANFTAAPTEGPAPLEVTFTNTTTATLTTSLWDFGDTFTSTLMNPTHNYGNVGSYTVTLTVDRFGITDTITKTNYINVYTPVVADFSATPITGTFPLTVTFSNLSTGDFNACLWDFGDTYTSTLCGPVEHTYQSAGSYTVTLTVSGLGGIAPKTKGGYINVYTLVVADFSATPITGTFPLTVTFSNLSTGDFNACLWDFGDTYTSTLCGPVDHTYQSAGSYTVTLTASGPGDIGTETKGSYINVYTPIAANFSANPTSGTMPLTVDFTNLSTGDFDTCLWDFGNTITSTLCSPPDQLYGATGAYTVTLTVNGLGGTDTESKVDYITVELMKFFLPFAHQ